MDDLSPTDLGLLRSDLHAASYAVSGVADLLGATAHAALSRNETTPAFNATADGSPLATLTRLWPLQRAVSRAAFDRALPNAATALLAAGLVTGDSLHVRAQVDLRPYSSDERDWWVLSDITPGLDATPNAVRADHVLGVSSASISLAQLTARGEVGSALDLGTGCGVQALHLAQHATKVVATDVNRRALTMARLTWALNEVDVEPREGSLYEPTPEAYDLIVTNPPFVISPATGDRLLYRDSGLPGDEVVRRVVSEASGHLRPGGLAQVLANWAHVEDRPWAERLEEWVAGSGCDVWGVQREVTDPAEYVELWLRDAGLHLAPDYVARYDAWVRWFDEQGITGVGFGWLNLRRSDRDEPVVRLEEWPHAVEQPLGPEVTRWVEATDLLAGLSDDEVLRTRWRCREDVQQETVGAPGAADPEAIVLRQQRGMRRARKVDTVEAALVGASDGELTLGQILGALADLLDVPEEDLQGRQATVRELVVEGFLSR